MLEIQGESTEIEKMCSYGILSSTISSLYVGKVSLDKKYETTFSFPRLSITVKSNYCNNNNHLMILPLTSGLFIKYLMVAWSVWTKFWYQVI